MGLASLFAHKLRSLLTMLGMIFGVGAVVAMLSITAGAQKEMMSFIDQLGVNNIIVEAHEALDRNELQTVRAVSPGLSFRDFRAIKENVSGLVAITPRKRFKPQKLLPKTNQDQPQLIGVYPNFMEINSLKLVEGRFFNDDEDKASDAVCVLGESAKVNLLGYEKAVGKYVKVNDTWLQVIGVLTPQASGDDVEGMLATVLERTREIGIRRAIGARQGDIVRQFLTEAVLISIVGGLIGIAFGFTLSKMIAWQAGWSTVVTTSSIVVAFGVSVFIGLLFGIYPAVQAAKLDPIEAIRYE